MTISGVHRKKRHHSEGTFFKDPYNPRSSDPILRDWTCLAVWKWCEENLTDDWTFVNEGLYIYEDCDIFWNHETIIN